MPITTPLTELEHLRIRLAIALLSVPFLGHSVIPINLLSIRSGKIITL